ncbi:hypothetical protein MP638_001612 [Amoeboaphelidium occidentale]|nr:hypothetical protein MP638_001612 [Amoeboaphelidium occidentale]
MTHSFELLPLEIHELVAFHCGIRDYIQLSAVSKKFKQLLYNPQTFKRYIMFSFDRDTMIILHYLFRQSSTPLVNETLKCLLETPNMLNLDDMDVKGSKALYEMAHAQGIQFLPSLHAQNRLIKDHPVYAAIFESCVALNDVSIANYLLDHSLVSISSLDPEWYFKNPTETMIKFMICQGAPIGDLTARPLLHELITKHQVTEAALVLQQFRGEADILAYAWNMAIFNNCPEIIKLLLSKYHVSPRADGYSGFKWAARKGYLQILELILPHLNKEEISHDFPIHLLIQSELKDTERIIAILIEKGIDVHHLDEIALRKASSLGNLHIVKMLCEQGGADISAVHYEAIRLAKENGHVDVYLYLLQKATEQHAAYKCITKTIQRRFINETAAYQFIPGTSKRYWL